MGFEKSFSVTLLVCSSPLTITLEALVSKVAMSFCVTDGIVISI